MSNFRQIAIDMDEKEAIIFEDQRDAINLATTIRRLKQPSGDYYIGTIRRSEKDDSWSGFKVWKTRKKLFYISKRSQKILDMWNSGEHTYESIGDKFFISRERVRQILAKEKKKGFEILDTDTVSKKRTEHKIIKILNLNV